MNAIERFEFHSLVVLRTYSLERELQLSVGLGDMREDIIRSTYNHWHGLQRETWTMGDVPSTAVVGKQSVLTLGAHARSQYYRAVEERVVV